MFRMALLITAWAGFLLLPTRLLAQQTQESDKPSAGTSQATPAHPQAHPAKVSAEDVARKNPVPATQWSFDRGQKLFHTQCAMCHGEKGDGKGELTQDLQIQPPDFTKPESIKERTDGELFAIIGSGTGGMPGQGPRMGERQKWHLVNFIRSLGGKPPEKPVPGEEALDNRVVVVMEPAKPESRPESKPTRKR